MSLLNPRDIDVPPGVVDVVLRNDLPSFVRAAFAEVSPGVELVWHQYLDLICSRLHAVANGEIRRLIITMPPRHLKSVCVSVALPAFFLGHNPAAEVMVVSYGQELSKTFADDTRKVMTSAFYRRIFDTRLAAGRQAIHAQKTTAGGIRRATSMEGAATGVGADLLIFDDPQKANGVLSAALRASTNAIYQNTFVGRSNDSSKSRTVIVMQRLHEDDFVGFVQTLGPTWEVLNLPAIAEEDEAIAYKNFAGMQMFNRSEGTALHPARTSLLHHAERRMEVGESIWATQYQQRPAPSGGGLIKTTWFKRYRPGELPEDFDQVLQSWDTAQTVNQLSDYSVCTTWGVKGKKSYLLDVLRKKLNYPDLKRAVVEHALLHRPTETVIEDHGSGTSLIQDLHQAGHARIRGVKPQGDKVMRMAAQAAPIENGFVHIPEEAHWLEEFLHEMAVFPNGKHDDQVDSTSQALDAINYTPMKGRAFYEIAVRANRANAGKQGIVDTTPCWAPGSMEWAAQQAKLAEEAAQEAAYVARQALTAAHGEGSRQPEVSA